MSSSHGKISFCFLKGKFPNFLPLKTITQRMFVSTRTLQLLQQVMSPYNILESIILVTVERTKWWQCNRRCSNSTVKSHRLNNLISTHEEDVLQSLFFLMKWFEIDKTWEIFLRLVKRLPQNNNFARVIELLASVFLYIRENAFYR